MSSERADSRDYVTPFDISVACDVPRDLELPRDLPEEFAGLFLPRDSGAFGLPRFAPCMLILTRAELWIVPRRAEHTRIPLASLEALECGRILLLGWIGFQWSGFERTLRYNRHAANIVERFLGRLKMSWLPAAVVQQGVEPRVYGAEADLKFGYARSAELLSGERIVTEFFQPSTCRTEGHLGFRHRKRVPGDLLLLTDRRFLWITERRQSAYVPYGTIGRSAPAPALRQIRHEVLDGGSSLEIDMHAGTFWRVPLAPEMSEEAKKFAEEVTRAIRLFPTSRPGCLLR
jgi:hypothetical protein